MTFNSSHRAIEDFELCLAIKQVLLGQVDDLGSGDLKKAQLTDRKSKRLRAVMDRVLASLASMLGLPEPMFKIIRLTCDDLSHSWAVPGADA